MNSHALPIVPVNKKNRIVSLLCIFETTTVSKMHSNEAIMLLFVYNDSQLSLKLLYYTPVKIVYFSAFKTDDVCTLLRTSYFVIE